MEVFRWAFKCWVVLMDAVLLYDTLFFGKFHILYCFALFYYIISGHGNPSGGRKMEYKWNK